MEGDEVPRGRVGGSEQDVGGIEVVERPQEHVEQQDEVDGAEHGQGDGPPLPQRFGAVEGRGLIHVGGDGLQPRHEHEEGEGPPAPDGWYFVNETKIILQND